MKNRSKPLILLFGLLFITAACAGPQTPDAAALQTSEAGARAATDAVATLTAQPTEIIITPSMTPTPGVLPFSEIILSTEELNGLHNVWNNPAVIDNTSLEEQQLCFRDCLHSRWLGQDGVSWIDITLIAVSNRDEGVILFDNLRQGIEEQRYEDKPIPDAVDLPPDSWISDGTAFDEGYALYIRNGSSIAVLKLDLDGMNLEQNTLFLSLYGQNQLKKMKDGGY